MSENGLTFDELIEGVEVPYDNNPEFMNVAIERAMNELVSNVQRYRKTGEITIKVKMKPLDEKRLSISGSLAVKIPQPSAAERTVYIDRKGKLSADDPQQPLLPGAVSNIR